MKLSRRKFFGAAGGAAIAGPSALKEAVASGDGLRGLLATGADRLGRNYSGDCDKVGTAEDQAAYIVRRRKELERIIRGEFEGWELIGLESGVNDEAATLANVAALASTSPAARVAMGRDALIRRRKRARIEDAKHELAQMAKNWLGLK